MTRTIYFIAIAAILLLGGCPAGAIASVVDEEEAAAVADYWYAAELNAHTSALSVAEKLERYKGMAAAQMLYLAGIEDLREQPPIKGPVWAYVVVYQPSGCVIVSGDDSVPPVLFYNVKTRFAWEPGRSTFLKEYLRRVIEWRLTHRAVQDDGAQGVHPGWTMLREKLATASSIQTAQITPSETFIQFDTPLWGQGFPYNELVRAQNGGNNVPTGCTATAMAILMRDFQWPWTGSGSHSYSDTWGNVKYSHSVNFAAAYYDYTQMPTTVLTTSNSEVAELMYHCGVAVDMNYEIGGSGAWPSADAMNSYFRYRGTVDKTSGHEAPIQACVLSKVPVILCTSDHTVVCCGYRSSPSPYYYINGGHNNSDDGWYNLDNLTWGDDWTIDHSYPYGTPNNYVYVDSSWGGSENGSLSNPYNTASEGNSAVPSGGLLFFRGGTYSGASNVPITFTKRMLIQSYRGTAVLRK